MRLLSASFLFFLAAPTLAVSQEIRSLGATAPAGLELDTGLAVTAASLPVAAPDLETPDTPAGQEAESSERTFLQILHAVGGAAVGAWAGYLASQVMVGSWDERGINRESWAAGGAALGVTLGLSIPMGRAGPQRATGLRGPDRRADRNLLTRDEIRESNAGSLYSIIRSLRPEWLRTRGTGSMRETPRGEASGTGEFDIDVTPGIATIKVYLDETYMGDQASLHQIDPALVGQVRFLDAAEATQRLGMGHIHGAIMVTIAPVP